MYAEFFGLREFPFNNTPDPRFFYSTPDHEEALASLIYAVKEKKGFVLLTGEVGAGKTLVSRLMIKHFAGTIAFANINHAIRDSTDLMESLCAEFELTHEKNAGNANLVRMLHDFLLAKFAQNTPVVLVLDEAQNLSIDAFEQLRMIGNLEADDAKLLQIAIVGQPELQTLFNSTALRQLRQRLFRSFHLPALNRLAVEGYIRHRLTVAGASNPAMFGPASIDAIHKASRGLPRLINTLCDNVMLSAYSADRKTFDVAFVESVLATIMVHDPSIATAAPVPARRTTPPPQQSAPPSERIPEPPQRQNRQQSEQLSATCDRAATLLSQIETGMQRSAAIAERLTAGADRAAQHSQQLTQCENKISNLLNLVKVSTARMVPLLEEMRIATRNASTYKESAQVLTRELGDQTSRAQPMLERITNALHHLRLAEMRVPSPPTHANPVMPLPPAIKLQEPSPAIEREVTPIPKIVRQASRPRSTVVIPAYEDDVQNPGRPALRLAQRMENLAALVHEAVTACTPG